MVVMFATFAVCEAMACPTCKEDLAGSPQSQGLATGFYYSILLMMSMPFLILGGLGTVFYRSMKRAQAQRDALVQQSPASS
ncbi:MAG TPA: hypothetical protein PJ982_04635 [Lacipirellulaceae bacterium]|nr:hypothetical protein [Lacipirellulaceae bacterium]